MNDAMPLQAKPQTSTARVATQTVLTTAGLRRGGRWQQQFIPVKNEPGELLRIDKTQLYIDPAYQRRVWPDRVQRYAANWSWISCGALIVAQRDPEVARFAIIDGQHRWEAAKLLKQVRDLPCLKFALDNIGDEATGFLATNTDRKFPSLAEQFKALMVVGDKTAIVADKLAKEAGRHISAPSSPTTISCVGEFMRLIQQHQAAVENAWPAISKLCEGHPMTARILRAAVGIERRLPRGQSLGLPHWVRRLDHIGWDAVTASIRTITQLESNGGERACADGLLRVLNRGLRQPLLVDLNRR